MTPVKEGPGDIGSTGFGEGPGASNIVGPGGQAPPFAPGGPDNPYPPSAGMPPPNATLPPGSSANQPGFIGSGAIGSGVIPGQPGFMGTPQYPGPPLFAPLVGESNQPLTAVGDSTANLQNPPYPPNQATVGGLPGHGTTPGRFQPGGGTTLPNQPGTLPSQRPGQALEQGFLAQIIPQGGNISRIIPMASGSVPGGGGQPGQPLPVPPGSVNPPTFPGQLPNIPGMPPPTIGGGPIIPPTEGGGPTSGKPKGVRTVAPPASSKPPAGPPTPPGQWVTLDAGKGKPPAWAFIESPDPSSDTGLGGPSVSPAGTKPAPPTGSEKGHYVAVEVPTVNPVLGGDIAEVLWAWVPTIDDTYGVKEPDATPKGTGLMPK